MIQNLPDEIIRHIFNYLDKDDVLHLSSVNKLFNSLKYYKCLIPYQIYVAFFEHNDDHMKKNKISVKQNIKKQMDELVELQITQLEYLKMLQEIVDHNILKEPFYHKKIMTRKKSVRFYNALIEFNNPKHIKHRFDNKKIEIKEYNLHKAYNINMGTYYRKKHENKRALINELQNNNNENKEDYTLFALIY